ncbi:hypothetical protein [Amycolatopsis sp. RTGN1]|uniref:hypothetical protein n=1 Tax=Amycolatopsis ponsaeliensis TaxID=2992142 RepID=UPI00254BDE78|nr:hypothetical protein [Amycolatopsis sp. RTGN1]
MTDEPWVRSPIGDRDKDWATLIGDSVLVLAPHIAALARLDDLIPLIEADDRIQRVYAVPECDTWPDVLSELHDRGEIVLPLWQAGRHEHGLVLAGSIRGTDQVRGPVMLVPHGGGFGQYRSSRPSDPEGRDPITGLHPDQLMRDGEVRAETIVLTHDRELELLTRFCPQAVPHALVAGDIAFDRLVASAPFRDHYRKALGVPDDREIVLVTSTWSPRSGFGSNPDLFRHILDALPGDRFQVVATLHPQIWSHHGTGQVLGWLSDSIRSGLTVLAPRTDWRGAVVAADYLMGDFTSVTGFAAGLGTPILRLPHGPQHLLPGSPTAVLAGHSPGWDPGRPLVPQLGAAVEAQSRGLRDRIAGLLTSCPGQAGTVLRSAMYRMLGRSQPARRQPWSPAPLPRISSGPRWFPRDES